MLRTQMTLLARNKLIRMTWNTEKMKRRTSFWRRKPKVWKTWICPVMTEGAIARTNKRSSNRKKPDCVDSEETIEMARETD